MPKLILIALTLLAGLGGVAEAASARIADRTAIQSIKKELGRGKWTVTLEGRKTAAMRGFTAVSATKKLRQGAVDMKRATPAGDRVSIFKTGDASSSSGSRYYIPVRDSGSGGFSRTYSGGGSGGGGYGGGGGGGS